MSHVLESDKFAFIPPTPVSGSEHGSPPSLRNWTILKLIAELQCRGIPFSATARKAELFRLLFSSSSQPQPSTSAENVSLLTSLTQIYTVLNMLSTSIQLLQDRMDVMEARPARVEVAAAPTAPVLAGTSTGNTSVPLPVAIPSQLAVLPLCPLRTSSLPTSKKIS